ncbi:unnamed protein product [Cyprideis torosa]|uniref:Nuclear nucleic acid-binding protein C1D n=1 Tax=Cyprideis torosa TaxID=163714 RepID=A0A7R8W7Q9_9CRUS|nr:unnamed protein product [Cyprideis torosa]CAG0887817.1 unnamed protein product [Cyprideis torosa]
MAEDFPEELTRPLAEFHRGVLEAENALAPLLNVPRDQLNATMTSLEKARLDLASSYATNTMFYVYLTLQGVDMKEHPLKGELGRIKSLMDQAQEIEDRASMPQVDVGAAKRFIRSGLWEAGKGEGAKGGDKGAGGQVFATSANSIQVEKKKRRHSSSSSKRRKSSGEGGQASAK